MRALTTANNTAGATQANVPAPTAGDKNRPSIIIVEFVGFGGDSGEENQPQDGQHKNDERRSERQDPNSAVRVLGAGDLTAQAQQFLSSDEKAKLGQH